MNIQYIKSQSGICPVSPDTTSSKKYVYLRRNVVELKQPDESTDNTYTYYEYEEAKLTKEEYELYLDELNSENTLKAIEALQEENQILNEQISILTECLLEMSAMVYA